MVKAVTEPRGLLRSGHGAARSSGLVDQRCRQPCRSLFAPARAMGSKERVPKGLTGWQLICRAAGF